jgi:hypothetical protein
VNYTPSLPFATKTWIDHQKLELPKNGNGNQILRTKLQNAFQKKGNMVYDFSIRNAQGKVSSCLFPKSSGERARLFVKRQRQEKMLDF